MHYKKNSWLMHLPNDPEFHAGNKFVSDIIEISHQMKIRTKEYGNLPSDNKFKRLFKEMSFMLWLIFTIKSGDRIYVIYPVREIYFKIFFMMKTLKKFRVISIIEDIDALREESRKIESDISLLSRMDGIIAQNKKQEKFLQSYGYKGPIKLIGVLDFLGIPIYREKRSISPDTICYGGTLTYSASGFLYKWAQELSVNWLKVKVYGIELQKNIDNDKFQYCGAYPPDEIVSKLEGDFGLVWNGTEIEECGGLKGKYYQYASPHKLSMYLMAGMPVIVSEESPLAEYVVENNIGFTTKSLNELENIVKNISCDEYNEMLDSVRKIQAVISKGQNLKRCISFFQT